MNKYVKLSGKLGAQMDLLGVRISSTPLDFRGTGTEIRISGKGDDYYELNPFSAELITGEILCHPNDNKDKNYWPIAVFSSVRKCCEAVLNKEKLGLAWDEENN